MYGGGYLSQYYHLHEYWPAGYSPSGAFVALDEGYWHPRYFAQSMWHPRYWPMYGYTEADTDFHPGRHTEERRYKERKRRLRIHRDDAEFVELLALFYPDS